MYDEFDTLRSLALQMGPVLPNLPCHELVTRAGHVAGLIVPPDHDPRDSDSVLNGSTTQIEEVSSMLSQPKMAAIL